MSVPRILATGPSCETPEGRFRVAELEDGRYALVTGNIRVAIRGTLPIDPCDQGRIDYYADFPEVERAWADCADSFESSGDHELAEKMRFAWADVWDEVVVDQH